MEYRIVKRAFSQYTTVEVFTGRWLDAMSRADALQAANRDGEYLLRRPGQPDWEPTSSYQSEMDWL